MRFVKVPLYSASVVSKDAFHPGPACSVGGIKGMSAVETVWYHVYFGKRKYSLPDATSFLPEFKPTFLKLISSSTEKRPQSVLEEAYRNASSAEREGTEARTARKKSSGKKGRASAAFAAPCRKRKSKNTTRRPAPNLRKRLSTRVACSALELADLRKVKEKRNN